MRYDFLLLGLALQVIACGDDSEGSVSDAGGGSGGEGGAAVSGGTGGRAAVVCPEGKQDTLEAFCATKDDCGLSALERWTKVCSPCTTSDCYFGIRNSCGGYSIQHVIGVDAYVDTYHYDADGALIGATKNPYGLGCTNVKDTYGTVCQRLTEEGRLKCDEPDAG